MQLDEDDIQSLLSDVTCATGVCNFDEINDTLSRQDEVFLKSHMAADCYEDLMGNEVAMLVTESVLFWYYAVSVIVAVIMLKMMGHKFWSL